MATLDLKSREQIVSDAISAVQAAVPGTYQFLVGSIVLAIMEADATIAVWEESLIQFVLARTRLSTSEGNDADTFVQDFGYARPAAIAASTLESFSSYDTSTQRVVLVGAQVATQVGGIAYSVIANSDNSLYDPTSNSYIIPIGQGSIGAPAQIPIQCNTGGVIGNQNANTINTIVSPITGIDIATNAIGLTNGIDQPNDPQLRVLFVQYLNGLKRATEGALAFAITSVQTDLSYVLIENTNYDNGTPQDGYFFAVIDDGSRATPTPLVNNVISSLEEYRGFTISYTAFAAIPLDANISATVVMPAGYSNANLQANIVSALTTYISLIPINDNTDDNTGTLFYSRIGHIIYQVIVNTVGSVNADLFNVTSVLLNSLTVDLTSTYKQKIYPGTIAINLTNA